MGKLYYCDYCDRSFVDDLQARKKHLQCTAHQRNRKLHYISCRDLKTLVEEESDKDECYKFRNHGHCQFGENCFRSHFTKLQLNAFRKQIAEEESYKKLQDLSKLRTVDSWLLKRNSVPSLQISSNVNSSLHIPCIPQPESIQRNLPPSLQPLNVGDLKNAEVSEWG